MTHQDKSEHKSGWQWEHAVVDDYYNYRWQQLGEPLCDTFRGWKAGELEHAEVDRAIEEAYKEKCVINDLFSQRPDRIVALIQWWDREWFEGWLEEHRLPSDVQANSVSSQDS